jgi:arylsulfatase A-like enzyme
MRIRATIVLAGGALALSLAVALGITTARAQEPPPNFVLLFADDLGYGDLASFGHPTIATPRLDRLAAEGIRLTSFYAEPACTPSRAALLTGRYSIRSGLGQVVGPDDRRGIPESEITFAEALGAKGYRTAAIGKWHLGHLEPRFRPLANGFDRYFGLLYSNDMIRPWVQTDRPLELWRDDKPIEHPVDQTTLTERYTDEAIRFIEEAGNRPFVLYLAYSMPHVPISASPRFAGRSRAGLYGDVVETIDWSAGRIVDALERRGLSNRTLVIFTSDNGPWLDMPDRMFGNDVIKPWHAGSTGPLRGAKGQTYEGGVRVPFIARWPGRIPAGRVGAGLGSVMDLYATMIRLAGAELPSDRPIDGVDMGAWLMGKGESPRPSLYYFRANTLEGVRDGRWKLRVTNHGRPGASPGAPPVPELYDLEVDPSERYDRASNHADVVTRLRAMMDQAAREITAPPR